MVSGKVAKRSAKANCICVQPMSSGSLVVESWEEVGMGPRGPEVDGRKWEL